MGRERGTRERERLLGRQRRDVAAGPRLSTAAFCWRAPPSPSLSPALACAQAGADKMKTCFVLVFWHLPSSATNPSCPPSTPFPKSLRLPFTIGMTQVLGQQQNKAKNTPWHPNHPQSATLGSNCSQPSSMAGGLLFMCVYIFFVLFFFPLIESLSYWVCVFLFKDPPPPVVLKPGRREPRAHFCLDAGAAREGDNDGGQEEGGEGWEGGKRSMGRVEKIIHLPRPFV